MINRPKVWAWQWDQLRLELTFSILTRLITCATAVGASRRARLSINNPLWWAARSSHHDKLSWPRRRPGAETSQQQLKWTSINNFFASLFTAWDRPRRSRAVKWCRDARFCRDRAMIWIWTRSTSSRWRRRRIFGIRRRSCSKWVSRDLFLPLELLVASIFGTKEMPATVHDKNLRRVGFPMSLLPVVRPLINHFVDAKLSLSH